MKVRLYQMSLEERASPTNAADFHAEVDDVFERIASRYDLLCDLFSFGIHRSWKRRVATLIASEPWTDLHDAATGTGDVILRVARQGRLQAHQKIVASDMSSKMLALARKRATSLGAPVEFKMLDAHAMPSVPGESVDLYSMSLGLKICERQQVLREAYRVLRPGGRLITLEASNISCSRLHHAYLRYMTFCMPFIGWVATRGDASAYRYLLKGIEDFPTAEGLAAEMAGAGFEQVWFERLSLGIVAIHVARKPLDGRMPDSMKSPSPERA